METHTGDQNIWSTCNSGALIVAAPKHCHENASTFDDADHSDFKLENESYISADTEHKYLHAILPRDCNDICEIDTRIRKASRALDSAQNQILNDPSVSNRAEGVVYTSLIVDILLHGAASCCLIEVTTASDPFRLHVPAPCVESH